MRARYPDQEGYVDRCGVKVYYEVYGFGVPTVLLLPTWSIIHSRRWKGQVPYLARHFRVVTFDGRGNGRSDRPRVPEAYADTEIVADALAILDATATDQAVIVGMSMGAGYALRLAADHAERVLGAVFTGASVGMADPVPVGEERGFWDEPATEDGWALYNAHSWRKDWRIFAEFFIGQIFSEPHSTKHIEDSVGWAMETDPETMLLAERADYLGSPMDEGSLDRSAAAELASHIRCPCLVIHGTDDHISDVSGGRHLAEALRCPLVLFEGSGHAPDARSPVRFNLLLRDFVRGLPARLEQPVQGGGA